METQTESGSGSGGLSVSQDWSLYEAELQPQEHVMTAEECK